MRTHQINTLDEDPEHLEQSHYISGVLERWAVTWGWIGQWCMASSSGRAPRSTTSLDGATDDDLHQPSTGTRWTNGQLLFRMLFGYLIVRAPLVLVHGFARLPAGIGRRFAGRLDSLTGPFEVVNYYGPGLARGWSAADGWARWSTA